MTTATPSSDSASASPALQKPNLFVRILRVLMSRVARVTVTGAEHLDGPGGKIVVCNHVGWSDPLWVGYAALPRKLHQMAKKELFETKLGAWFVSSGGGFPVDRGSPSTATIRQVVSLVQAGQLVLIFPGGTRNAENPEAKRGAATIALRAKGQIVPAHYDGPGEIRASHFFTRPRIRITFGPPIVLPPDATANKESALALTLAMDEAMKRVAEQRPG